MENQEAYYRARRRVKAKISILFHLMVYIVVNSMLIIINLSTATEYLWFKWPLLGWGIGVVFHALGVFVFAGGSAIKKRWIEKEMGRRP